MDGVYTTIPLLVKACAFGLYFVMGGYLDYKKAFLSISIFDTINSRFSSMIMLTPHLIEAYTSITNVNDYFNGKDIPLDIVKKASTKQSSHTSAIKVKGGTFSWERTSPYPTLRNINVDIRKDSLVAVVGVVGCGKSSLLSCILGEMEKLDGSVVVEGRTAYVPQEAWIRSCSFRDNILFGSTFDFQKYCLVIKCCNLKSDVDILTTDDQTEIGEKGINLSGGQKQRVSLARAVYNDADVYLLDDPLSAVDAHVGKSIFNKVIGRKGLLKNKTRVLVTHGIQWLPFVDSIIVMKDGQIVETGTFKNLLLNGGCFADFLHEVCSNSSQDEDVEVKQMKQNIFKRLNSREYQEQVICYKHEKHNLPQIYFADHGQQSEEKVQNEQVDSFDTEKDMINLTCFDSDLDDDRSDSWDNISDSVNSGKSVIEELDKVIVSNTVYLKFLKAIGPKLLIILILVYILGIVALRCNEFLVNGMTKDSLILNPSHNTFENNQARQWFYYWSFVLSGLVYCVLSFIFVLMCFWGCFSASCNIHNTLLNNVMRCPMSFFETTLSSQVMSRFVLDTMRVDTMSHSIRGFIQRSLLMISSLILMITNAPTILFCVIPVAILYCILQRIHINTIRQLRHFRSSNRPLIWFHISETLQGVSSIRAYENQDMFYQIMETKVENALKHEMMGVALSKWFDLRVIWLYLLIQLVAGIVIVMDTRMTVNMAGIVLMYITDFSRNMGEMMSLVTGMETEMTSLARILVYSKKPTEAPWEIPQHKPESNWPTDGRIVLNDLKTRYRDGLDLVLKGVTCHIKKGEKIGIVGRTGAGKSSLTMALFRMIEATDGYIKIDGEKLSDLGLHDLRRKLTILPQDPVIFAGSLRMNLDPSDKFTTDELWVALKHAHLKTFVEGLDNQLDFECGEGGKNMSVGQRQLLCLARTLLRQTKILVLDEATAAVDMETDKLIQKTIRTEFQDCTVLSIAHRLHTIMDYDRILVLDQGIVKEFDSPRNLLANKQSVFYGLAQDAKLVR